MFTVIHLRVFGLGSYIDTVKDMYKKRKDGDLSMEEVKRVQCPIHAAKDRL